MVKTINNGDFMEEIIKKIKKDTNNSPDIIVRDLKNGYFGNITFDRLK